MRMDSKELPLERLKTEAERWIACVATDGSTSGPAARGVRELVQKAYDLAMSKSIHPEMTGETMFKNAADILAKPGLALDHINGLEAQRNELIKELRRLCNDIPRTLGMPGPLKNTVLDKYER